MDTHDEAAATKAGERPLRRTGWRRSAVAARLLGGAGRLPVAAVGCDRACDRAGSPRALDVGEELEVRIAGAGAARVRVLHRDRQSLTLGTVEGHPEAGRITFGAYRNRRGDVIFHIRSRARSSSPGNYLGFLGIGEAMQTSTWVDFVNRVAVATGRGVLGVIHAETREIADEDDRDVGSPTYEARGD
jgi:hypothetical protein